MYAAIEFFRYPLTGNEFNLIFMIGSLSSTILFVAVGLFYFKKTEDFFADFA